MPKDSKIKKTAKKPNKSKEGNKTKNIRERAFARAKQFENSEPNDQYAGPINTLIIYGSDEAAANKISRGLYSDELLPKIEKLAAKGLNNAQMAKALCIGNRTFYDWRDKYPQFMHALNKYRGVADIFVENALYNTATGYAYQEQQVSNRGDVVTVNKWQPGNASAQIFYLKNRMPDRYKDKVETVHSAGAGMEAITFTLKKRE